MKKETQGERYAALNLLFTSNFPLATSVIVFKRSSKRLTACTPMSGFCSSKV